MLRQILLTVHSLIFYWTSNLYNCHFVTLINECLYYDCISNFALWRLFHRFWQISDTEAATLTLSTPAFSQMWRAWFMKHWFQLPVYFYRCFPPIKSGVLSLPWSMTYPLFGQIIGVVDPVNRVCCTVYHSSKPHWKVKT